MSRSRGLARGCTGRHDGGEIASASGTRDHRWPVMTWAWTPAGDLNARSRVGISALGRLAGVELWGTSVSWAPPRSTTNAKTSHAFCQAASTSSSTASHKTDIAARLRRSSAAACSAPMAHRAYRFLAACHAHAGSLDEVVAMTIPLPAVVGAKPPGPLELHGRVLGRSGTITSAAISGSWQRSGSTLASSIRQAFRPIAGRGTRSLRGRAGGLSPPSCSIAVSRRRNCSP